MYVSIVRQRNPVSISGITFALSMKLFLCNTKNIESKIKIKLLFSYYSVFEVMNMDLKYLWYIISLSQCWETKKSKYYSYSKPLFEIHMKTN